MLRAHKALIFDGWLRRYELNPQEFLALLDENGKAIPDYGVRCAVYMDKIEAELRAEGRLPALVIDVEKIKSIRGS